MAGPAAGPLLCFSCESGRAAECLPASVCETLTRSSATCVYLTYSRCSSDGRSAFAGAPSPCYLCRYNPDHDRIMVECHRKYFFVYAWRMGLMLQSCPCGRLSRMLAKLMTLRQSTSSAFDVLSSSQASVCVALIWQPGERSPRSVLTALPLPFELCEVLPVSRLALLQQRLDSAMLSHDGVISVTVAVYTACCQRRGPAGPLALPAQRVATMRARLGAQCTSRPRHFPEETQCPIFI